MDDLFNDKWVMETRVYFKDYMDKIINNGLHRTKTIDEDFIRNAIYTDLANSYPTFEKKPYADKVNDAEIKVFTGYESYYKYLISRFYEYYLEESKRKRKLYTPVDFFRHGSTSILQSSFSHDEEGFTGGVSNYFLCSLFADKSNQFGRNRIISGTGILAPSMIYDNFSILFSTLPNEYYLPSIEDYKDDDVYKIFYIMFMKYGHLMIKRKLWHHVFSFMFDAEFTNLILAKKISEDYTIEELKKWTELNDIPNLKDEMLEVGMDRALRHFELLNRFLDAGFIPSYTFVKHLDKYEILMLKMPTRILVDEMNNFSSLTNPAIEFEDGSEMYAINNLYFSKEMWEKVVNKTITKKDIKSLLPVGIVPLSSLNHYWNWENRITQVFETIGYGKVLEMFRHKLVQTYTEKDFAGRDLVYKLYECKLPEETHFCEFPIGIGYNPETITNNKDEYEEILKRKIRNYTRLTSRIIEVEWYIDNGKKEVAYLRVPPKELSFIVVINGKTGALEGIKNVYDIKGLLAWTFYKKPDEYKPVLQT